MRYLKFIRWEKDTALFIKPTFWEIIVWRLNLEKIVYDNNTDIPLIVQIPDGF